MSDTKNTGGPAFPIPNVDHAFDGMTLRDHFAGLAMNGLLSDSTCDTGGWDDFAREAYVIADAMLKAREQ
jgi:hypothetical protein